MIAAILAYFWVMRLADRSVEQAWRCMAILPVRHAATGSLLRFAVDFQGFRKRREKNTSKVLC
jgi:hypothetical protein